MADTDDFATLAECDPEDIEDVINIIRQSFGIKFGTDAFAHVNTFGDLCNVFEQHMPGENIQDCTSQQAFYRVRKAISTATDYKQILPGSKLQDIFPPTKKRRRSIQQFRDKLGIQTNMLTYTDRGWFIILGIFICSVIAFLFSWKFAVTGILLGTLLIKLSGKFGNVLIHDTVSGLVEELTLKHYTVIRRNSGTFNKNEISKIIIETFNRHLFIDKTSLTSDANFGWQKKDLTNYR